MTDAEQRQLDEIRTLLWTSQAPLDQQNLKAMGGPPNVPPRLHTPMTLDPDPQAADMSQFASSMPDLDMNTPLQRGADRRGAFDMALVNEGTLAQPPAPSAAQRDAQDFLQFYNELPWGLKYNIATEGMPTALSVFGAKRQQMALEMEKLQDARKQKMFDNFINMDKQFAQDPDQWDQQMKLEAAKGNPHARMALEVGDKKMKGEYASVLPLVQTYYPKFAQKYAQNPNEVSKSEMKAVLTNVAKIKERRALADADAQEMGVLEAEYQNYITNGTPMGPGNPERLIELRQQQQKKDLELEKLRSEITKNKALANKSDDPKVTQMADEISMELFDKPFLQLGLAQREQVSKEKEKRIQGRTSSMITQGLPAPLKEQADIYTQEGLNRLELEKAPSGLTEAQYRTGPYRQLDEKEKDALIQYKVAVKTVDTMNKVANKLITATTPAQAAAQWTKLHAGAVSGKNGLAAAYLKDLDSFSSRMARLVEVGVLTNTDVTRWSNTFASFGDTVHTVKAKQALFGEIQDETARLLRTRLGGKQIGTTERSSLDKLLDKTDQFSTADKDFDILMGK